jgi:Ulp1 family protease
MTVSTVDYLTLEYGEWLNDVIVDFVLSHSVHNLDTDRKKEVFVFTSYFYHALTKQPEPRSSLWVWEQEAALPRAQRQHARVALWTKDVDLMSKDLVVFPICDDGHWFCIVAVALDKDAPVLVVLDSLGKKQKKALIEVADYLQLEGRVKGNIRLLTPSLPTQQNGSDCGLFLLHYAQKLLQDSTTFLGRSERNLLRHWFPLREVLDNRAEIADLVQSLAKEQQQPGQALPPFPSLDFWEDEDQDSRPTEEDPPERIGSKSIGQTKDSR